VILHRCVCVCVCHTRIIRIHETHTHGMCIHMKKDERRTHNIIRNRVKITHQKADASRSHTRLRLRTYAHTHTHTLTQHIYKRFVFSKNNPSDGSCANSCSEISLRRFVNPLKYPPQKKIHLGLSKTVYTVLTNSSKTVRHKLMLIVYLFTSMKNIPPICMTQIKR